MKTVSKEELAKAYGINNQEKPQPAQNTGYRPSQGNNSHPPQNTGYRPSPITAQPQPARPKEKPQFMLPDEDYVEIAEKCMEKIIKGKYNSDLTTSKIRNILSMVSEISNKLKMPGTSFQTVAGDIKYLKIRLVYESGRASQYSDLRRFINEAKLIEGTDFISDVQSFNRYAKYLEALVAYHRYFGGSDK